jgi:hypothetical protein
MNNMLIPKLCAGILTVLTLTSIESSASRLTGPLTNSANGHLYYLLNQATWSAAETEARTLGGHLATVNDQSEQDWIYTTFSNFGGLQRHLWIGLYDANQTINDADRLLRQGEFVWISSDASAYDNWSPFEPSNSGGNEQVVHMWYPGDSFAAQWNDADANLSMLSGAPMCGVVEVDPALAGLETDSVLATAVPEIVYVPGSAQKVSQLVGDHDNQLTHATENLTWTRYQLAGTDLGVPVTHKGRTYVLFGDTHGGYSGDRDAIAFSTDTNLADGMALTFLTNASGVWNPITIPGITQGALQVPAEGVSVNDRLYVYHTTDRSAVRIMGRSVLAVSQDDGQTFNQLYTLSTRHFINLSLVKAGVEEWPGSPTNSGEGLYIFGAGDYRASNLRLAFQPTGGIESLSSIRYFAGVDNAGAPTWSTAETNAVALFDHPCVGEFSVAYNRFLGRWLMLYNCGYPRGINFRTAPTPWGPWSDPQVMFEPWVDGGYCHFIHTSWMSSICDSVHDAGRENEWGGEYGPYLFENFAEGSNGWTRIYFTLSTWNPYTVVLMRADLSRQTNSDVALPVSSRSTWRYLDDGSNQGTAWRQTNFNDISWPLGNGEFGYGDGDEKTVIQSGPDGAHYLTAYFRKSFQVSDPTAFSSLTIRLRRDDGGVVYLNGQEVFRSNLTAGTVTWATPAASDVSGANESAFFTASVSPTNLVVGKNVIAVEIHQVNAASADASCDVELRAERRPPQLGIHTESAGASVTWPASFPAHVLESTHSLSPTTLWQRVMQPKSLQGDAYAVSLSVTNETHFYRLRRE